MSEKERGGGSEVGLWMDTNITILGVAVSGGPDRYIHSVLFFFRLYST